MNLDIFEAPRREEPLDGSSDIAHAQRFSRAERLHRVREIVWMEILHVGLKRNGCDGPAFERVLLRHERCGDKGQQQRKQH